MWHLDSGPQWHERVHDASARMVRYPLGSMVRDLSFDAADRITNYSHLERSGAATPAAVALNQGFGYDELGRLTSVLTIAGSWGYTYDASGNRTSVAGGGVTRSATVAGDSNRLTALTNPPRSLSHDAVGNTVADTEGSATLRAGYDIANRLAELRSTTDGFNFLNTGYLYNAFGQRVAKLPGVRERCNGPICFAVASASFGVIYAYDQQGQLLGEYSTLNGATLREYVWLGGMPVAVVIPDPANPAGPASVFYVHADHLDAPRVVVDRAGSQRWTWMADPFGSGQPNANPQGMGAFVFNLRLPGQYYDEESRLHYNGFRDYDPSLGRYTTPDPLGLDGGDVSLYSYAEGQPTSLTDPLGLQTYSCTRPLKGLGGFRNDSLRLFHQFVCTGDPATGRVSCGSIGPSGSARGSPSVVAPEKYKPERCEKREDKNACVESCVQRRLRGPLPEYDVLAGSRLGKPGAQQCQIFSGEVISSCVSECLQSFD